MDDLVGQLELEAARARGCLVGALFGCSFQESDEAIQQLSIYLLWTLDLPVAESPPKLKIMPTVRRYLPRPTLEIAALQILYLVYRVYLLG